MKQRLFFAIPIPLKLRRQFDRGHAATGNRAVKWIRLENYHITVHFIGDTPLLEIPAICQKVTAFTEQLDPFELQFKSTEIISRNGNPSMIWATFEESEAYRLLATITGELLGNESDFDPIPHITLAYLKDSTSIKKADIQLNIPTFNLAVNRIELWSSMLTEKHAIYKSIHKFPFNQ